MNERVATIQEAALDLARSNAEAEPRITRVYLFPSDEEIRLVEVDESTTPSGEEISPFYFSADPQEGIPFPSGIALILPDEVDRAKPPEGWCDWNRAKVIWPPEETENP
jgi:hypothetical protein